MRINRHFTNEDIPHLDKQAPASYTTPQHISMRRAAIRLPGKQNMST